MPAVTIKQRIIDDVTRDIRSGALAPGSQLPTSPELQATYNADSLTPVRGAIGILTALGFVRAVPGVGVFVTDNPPI